MSRQVSLNQESKDIDETPLTKPSHRGDQETEREKENSNGKSHMMITILLTLVAVGLLIALIVVTHSRKDEISQLQDSLSTMNADIDTANANLEQTNADLATTNTALDEKTADLAEANEQLDAANADLDIANDALNDQEEYTNYYKEFWSNPSYLTDIDTSQMDIKLNDVEISGSDSMSCSSIIDSFTQFDSVTEIDLSDSEMSVTNTGNIFMCLSSPIVQTVTHFEMRDWNITPNDQAVDSAAMAAFTSAFMGQMTHLNWSNFGDMEGTTALDSLLTMPIAWISGAPNLYKVILWQNNLNKTQTQSVMDALLQNPNLANFWQFWCCWCDFSTSTEQLAQVIANSTELELLDLNYQVHAEVKITATYTPATPAGVG